MTKGRKRPTPIETPKSGYRTALGGALVAIALVTGAIALYYATKDDESETRKTAAKKAESEILLEEVSRLRRSGQPQQAIKYMSQYIFVNNKDVVVRPVLAETLLSVNLVAEASRVVADLMVLQPQSPIATWLMGKVMQQRGDKNYITYLRKAADSPRADGKIISDFGLHLLSAGEPQEAMEYLKKAYDLGYREGNALKTLGAEAFKTNDFAAAEKYLAEAHGHLPRDIDLLVMLSEARRYQQKFLPAERALLTAAKGNMTAEQRCRVQFHLAIILEAQQRWGDAAGAYKQAAEVFLPLRGESYFRSARCYYFAGKIALAMEQIDLAAENKADTQTAEFTELAKKIEDARFGSAQKIPGWFEK